MDNSPSQEENSHDIFFQTYPPKSNESATAYYERLSNETYMNSAESIRKKLGRSRFENFQGLVIATFNVVSDREPHKEEKAWDEKQDTATFEYNGFKKITNFEEAIEYCKVDLDIWEVERKLFNSWDVTMKGTDGQPMTKTNYQFKLWFKKKAFTATDANRLFLQDIKKIRPIFKPIQYRAIKEPHLLEIDIFDPHLGKLCWDKESQHDYDLDIAADMFLKAIDDLLAKSSMYEIEQILFPLGNDYFNSDNLNNTTTAGTPQSEDTRWQKTFTIGRQVAIESIHKLSRVAPVEVKIVQGNHDFQRMYYLGDLLETYFENSTDITIDNSPKTRKYFRYGKCGIGFTHGNEEKTVDLPNIMLREMQKEWFDVDFMEWHLGHFHKGKTMKWVSYEEIQGIIIRFLRSLSGTDAWHFKKGYANGLRGADSFLWHKEAGNVGNFSSIVI